jgi:hypothetical protein
LAAPSHLTAAAYRDVAQIGVVGWCVTPSSSGPSQVMRAESLTIMAGSE